MAVQPQSGVLVQQRAQTAAASRAVSSSRSAGIGHLILVLLVVAFFLAPFAWMVLSSFKTALQIIELPPPIVFRPTLQNYINVFQTQNFAQYFWNSLVVGLGSTALSLALGLPAAYSIARHKQRGLALAILIAARYSITRESHQAMLDLLAAKKEEA